MITDRINNNLSALFDSENQIYKVLISDSDGTIPETINKPSDIDIGMIASQKEYLRRLALYLVRQMYLDQAETVILEYILNNFFDSLRLTDETDQQWINRVLATVFNHKVSRATIIFALRPFSSQEPEITNVIEDAAFADFSYADVYVRDTVEFEGGTVYVLPAVAEDFESAFYTIRITLYDTPLSEVFTVRDILDKVIAAGITVQFFIKQSE
jgi:hypothetical protein